MVAAHDMGQDKTVLDPVNEVLGTEEIVDTPADVPLSGGSAVAPPGVSLLLIGIEMVG